MEAKDVYLEALDAFIREVNGVGRYSPPWDKDSSRIKLEIYREWAARLVDFGKFDFCALDSLLVDIPAILNRDMEVKDGVRHRMCFFDDESSEPYSLFKTNPIALEDFPEMAGKIRKFCVRLRDAQTGNQIHWRGDVRCFYSEGLAETVFPPDNSMVLRYAPEKPPFLRIQFRLRYKAQVYVPDLVDIFDKESEYIGAEAKNGVD